MNRFFCLFTFFFFSLSSYILEGDICMYEWFKSVNKERVLSIFLTHTHKIVVCIIVDFALSYIICLPPFILTQLLAWWYPPPLSPPHPSGPNWIFNSGIKSTYPNKQKAHFILLPSSQFKIKKDRKKCLYLLNMAFKILNIS